MNATETISHRSLLLQTKKLAIGYKQANTINTLLKDLSLSITQGELIGFMGPNGIGKSTLLRTLAGLQAPLHGSVSLPSSRKGVPDPELVAVVLTDKITAVNMTVYELVSYGRYPHIGWNVQLTKSDRLLIEEAIEATHISGLVDKRLYQLSDGQLQMVMIARALAQNTPLILLDEPTAHLDLNNRVEITNLLRSLTRNKGKGIMMATHELDLALQTADRIWLAGTKQNIIEGIPEDLVLNGSFDSIFKFKGFDLRTGRVSHEPWRKKSIRLQGEGHHYLWTKNALERNGFTVDSSGTVNIGIEDKDGVVVWKVHLHQFSAISSLLEFLLAD